MDTIFDILQWLLLIWLLARDHFHRKAIHHLSVHQNYTARKVARLRNR